MNDRQQHQSIYRRKLSQQEWDELPVHVRSMLHDEAKRLYAIRELPDQSTHRWI